MNKGDRPIDEISEWNMERKESCFQVDKGLEVGTFSDMTMRRSDKRRFGMVPIIEESDRKVQAVAKQKETSPKKEDEDECEELRLIPRERSHRRSKLFFVAHSDEGFSSLSN